MRNDAVWPFPQDWVDWVREAARMRGVELAGLVGNGRHHTPCELEDAAMFADHVTVGQCVSCGSVRTHLCFWTGGEISGFWLPAVGSADARAEWRWRVLVVEGIVLSQGLGGEAALAAK